MTISITLTEKELNNDKGNGGLEIHIPGTAANPTDVSRCPVFIEKFKGQYRVVIWNGDENPLIVPLNKLLKNICPSCKADLSEKYSVARRYSNKDVPDGRGDAYNSGHYDEEGDFIPDRNISLSDARYDLQDGSDTCTRCQNITG